MDPTSPIASKKAKPRREVFGWLLMEEIRLTTWMYKTRRKYNLPTSTGTGVLNHQQYQPLFECKGHL